MAINVFSKRRPAAILDFIRTEISRYFWFWDADLSLRAKYCVNICNSHSSTAVRAIFKMAAAAILDIAELKYDDSVSNSQPICTFAPNFVKISQTAAELWRLMCSRNSDLPPSWILSEAKCHGISGSGTPISLYEQNIVSICAIATEVPLLQWFFKMAAAAILDIVLTQIWRQRK